MLCCPLCGQHSILGFGFNYDHLLIHGKGVPCCDAIHGCTQTIAILLTEQLMRSKYEESQKGNMTLALDLENTVVVISPLIPWNIAGLVPATVLSTNAGFIPFACYLYLLPLVN